MTQQYVPSKAPRDSSLVDNFFSVSEDGYVRLSPDELLHISLGHFMSGLDEDMPVSFSRAAVATEITGYTEWLTAGTPAITIGWDWQMVVSGGQIILQRVGEPRSNLMLQDSDRQDVGPVRTVILLEEYIDSLTWQWQVQQYINNSYSHAF
ncbi:DUF4902 domain-containing protein [Glaciimonas soli]|uniref:DUF4902 domain-containing protein n=1 Tax=Glaciimonas soli TaxID=2590999 RepID=A0A843YPD0_9BURK|nr:DUF4902 domain-containing protein [Glaciimonas soli]MQR00860.1 DUF4902 domain-containing protein [Glaciimonas soli]